VRESLARRMPRSVQLEQPINYDSYATTSLINSAPHTHLCIYYNITFFTENRNTSRRGKYAYHNERTETAYVFIENLFGLYKAKSVLVI